MSSAMSDSRKLLAPLVGLLLFAVTAEASVLCAKRRRDGSFNGAVKIRQACRSGEVGLTPDMVGFCCTVTTTTSSTAVSTTMPCPTTTTLGAPPCQMVSGQGCLGVCLGGQTCADDGGGQCICSGPLQCGVNGVCGGSCPAAQTCQPFPGCTSAGPCECR